MYTDTFLKTVLQGSRAYAPEREREREREGRGGFNALVLFTTLQGDTQGKQRTEANPLSDGAVETLEPLLLNDSAFSLPGFD